MKIFVSCVVPIFVIIIKKKQLFIRENYFYKIYKTCLKRFESSLRSTERYINILQEGKMDRNVHNHISKGKEWFRGAERFHKIKMQICNINLKEIVICKH